MAYRLELRFLDGRTEEHVLSRSQPLSIGRQEFNDVVVAEPVVAPLHCRISWNKSHYEVVAATSNGVELNGSLVQHAPFEPGDMLRIGSCDLRLVADESPARPAKPAKPDQRIRFSTSSDDDDDDDAESPAPRARERSRDKPAREGTRREGRTERVASVSPKPVANSPAEPSPQIPAAPVAAPVVAKAAPAPRPVVLPSDAPREHSALNKAQVVTPDDSLEVSISELPQLPMDDPAAKAARAPKPDELQVALSEWKKPRRPGEQEVLRSPLILGLTAAAIALSLLSATVWFLMTRQAATQSFDLAQEQLEQGNLTQATESYQAFLENYPLDSRARRARIGLARAQVRQLVQGGGAWDEALRALTTLLTEHQSDESYVQWQAEARQLAEEISVGAARSAQTQLDRKWLTVVEQGQTLIQRLSTPDTPPTVPLANVAAAVEKAETALRRSERLAAALQAIRAALDANDPVAAFAARSEILRRYPALATHAELQTLFQQSLEKELSIVQTDTEEHAANAGAETPAEAVGTTPFALARVRTDEPRSGRSAFASIKGTVYGFDAVTGEPLWRVVTGTDGAFFPQAFPLAQPAVLLHEPLHSALVARNAATGAAIWSQPLESPPTGPPLLHEGQLYLSTEANELLRIDAVTGLRSARLVFPRRLVGPPMLTRDGQHFLIPGDASLIYTLTRRPLAPVTATYTGHAAGSVRVPMLSLGRLSLMVENSDPDASRLRIFSMEDPAATLSEAESGRVPGPVLNLPSLRGAQLVIPSVGERLTAFSVSDVPGSVPLKLIGNYQIPGGYGGTCSVVQGPDDQFWLAGSAFRRFELTTDSIRLDPNTAAAGMTIQPLQLDGERFLIGRRLPGHAALVVTPVDRERMTSTWKATIGARPIAIAFGASGPATIVTEAGQVWQMSETDRARSGAIVQSPTELDWPATAQPLLAATGEPGASEPLAVVAPGAGEQPTQSLLWRIGGGGTVRGKQVIPALVEAPPALLPGGLVLATPNRLSWVSQQANETVQDFVTSDLPADQTWDRLWSLSDGGLVARHGSGRLYRLARQSTPVPHLAALTSLEWPESVAQPVCITPDLLWMADRTGQVRGLDPTTLEPRAERAFGVPLAAVEALDDALLVATVEGEVQRLSPDAELTPVWSQAASGQFVGRPQRQQQQVLWSTRDGRVVSFDWATGDVVAESRAHLTSEFGLISRGPATWLVCDDGTWWPVPGHAPPVSQPSDAPASAPTPPGNDNPPSEAPLEDLPLDAAPNEATPSEPTPSPDASATSDAPAAEPSASEPPSGEVQP